MFTIQNLRDVIANIPTLAAGQLFYATDTHELWVGSVSGNVKVGTTNASSITSGVLAVAEGGTGVTTSTGTVSVVLNTNPTFSSAITVNSTDFTNAVQIINTTAASTLSPNLRFSDTSGASWFVRKSGTGLLALSPAGGNPTILTLDGTSNPTSIGSTFTSTTAFANVVLRIASNAANADSTINLTDGVSNNAYIGMQAGKINFGAGGTTVQMTLDTSGNLNVQSGVYKNGGTSGVSAGPFTTINSITTTGGLVTALSGSSDKRLKYWTGYGGGLKEIEAITPVRYRWNKKGQKHTGLDGKKAYVGFLAQDVQKVIPEAITATEGTEKYLALDDRPIVAALVNAIKELSAKVKKLEKKLADGDSDGCKAN